MVYGVRSQNTICASHWRDYKQLIHIVWNVSSDRKGLLEDLVRCLPFWNHTDYIYIYIYTIFKYKITRHNSYLGNHTLLKCVLTAQYSIVKRYQRHTRRLYFHVNVFRQGVNSGIPFSSPGPWLSLLQIKFHPIRHSSHSNFILHCHITRQNIF